MKLIERLFSRQISELAVQQANSFNDVMYQFVNANMPIAPKDNPISYMREGYQSNEDVYSIVTKIATKCAMCPVLLYEVQSNVKLKQYKAMKNGTTPEAQFMATVLRTKALKEVDKHNILEILERPNPQQSGFEWKMSHIIFQLITGNSYVWGNEGMEKGIFHQLFNLPAHLTAIVGGTKFEPVEGYRVDWSGQSDFIAAEVLHIKYPGFDYDRAGGHLYGQSPLKVALRNTIQRNNSANLQATKQMNNAGVLGIVSNDQEKYALSDPQKKALEDRMRSLMGSDNEFDRWMVANGKLNWTQMGFSAKDLEILSSLQWDQKKLCNIFGYPIQLLNSEEASTDNNMKWAAKNLINNTVAPLLNQLDDGLNRFFVRPFSKRDGREYYLEHDISSYPEMQEDMKELAEWLGAAWWIKGKDKQAVMKFTQDESEPLMDQYLIPSNLIPADDISSLDKEFSEASKKSIDY